MIKHKPGMWSVDEEHACIMTDLGVKQGLLPRCT